MGFLLKLFRDSYIFFLKYPLQNLQKGKEILKEIDTLTLSNVEHLISVRKITTAEGISILNDTTFAAKIAEELIGAVEVIFSKDISN